MSVIKADKVYHIGRDGAPRICKATVRECHLGGIGTHYNSMAQAIKVSENLNQQLAYLEENGVMAIAKVDEVARPTKDLEKAIMKLNHFKYNLRKIEAVFNAAKSQLAEQLGSGDKIRTDKGLISFKSGTTRSSFDKSSFYTSEDFAKHKDNPDLYKSTTVSSHTQVSTHTKDEKAEAKLNEFKASLTSYDGQVVNIEITRNDDGTIYMNKETQKAIDELWQFRDTIERAKAESDKLRDRIETIMRASNVDKLLCKNTVFEIVPESERRDIDLNYIKAEGLYQTYLRTTDIADTVAFRKAT